MKENKRLNIEQQRATTAFAFAEEGKNIKDYGSSAKKVPAYIRNNGLGNTIAFIYSKSSKAHWEKIYKQIDQWMRKSPHPNLSSKFPVDKELALAISELDTEHYRLATREVLALFNWLRRFAKDET